VLPVYGGNCLSLKAVHNWVEKFSQERLNVADDARPVAEVAQTTVKRISVFAGFDALINRRNKCINIGGGYVEKCFFSVSNIPCFAFCIHL
jgi:hypothetical protein